MTKELAIAFAEVYEILKITSKEMVDQVPADVMDMLEKHRDKTYNFSVDRYTPLHQQPLTDKTRALLSVLYREYWVSPEERKRLWEEDEKKLLKQRLKHYEELMEEEDAI